MKFIVALIQNYLNLIYVCLMNRIAILASGSGSNAENIIHYFAHYINVEVCLILSNNKEAYVLERAKSCHVPSRIFSNTELNNTKNVLRTLKEFNVSIVILAGFLLKIPEYLIEAYPNRIVNIHPSLLPKYGGKGMYGINVHRAVVAAGEKETGITIHYVNKHYDDGAHIFQARCEVKPTDSPEQVQEKVSELERIHFPKVIETLL